MRWHNIVRSTLFESKPPSVYRLDLCRLHGLDSDRNGYERVL